MYVKHSPRTSAQRGAVLIHVAIALLGLVAFSTFVADYGIMWVSRGQAQTSADAGALSGAIALAFENSTDFAAAKEKARAVAISNGVFGTAPDVQLSDVTFPPCPPGAPGVPDTCVKVDAFRNLARGNPLPVFFGAIVGLNSQGVRATATAQILTGDTTECLKPWAILDRWDEYDAATGAEPDWPNPDPDFGPLSTFDRYSTGQGQSPAQENDLYKPPGGANGTGTGFTLPADLGHRFAVKVGDSGDAISPGWFRAIRIARLDGQNGGNVYSDNIATCGGLPASYAGPGTVCPTDIGNGDRAYWQARGCYGVEPGNMVGPTKHGVEALIARDPGAFWGSGGVQNSAFSPTSKSPRIVPIGVFDVDHYLAADPTGSNGVVRLVNIYGYFIEGMGDVENDGTMTLSNGGKSVIGRIMTVPSMANGASELPIDASFLRQVILVR